MNYSHVTEVAGRSRKAGVTWFKVVRGGGEALWEKEEDLEDEGCHWLMEEYAERERDAKRVRPMKLRQEIVKKPGKLPPSQVYKETFSRSRHMLRIWQYKEEEDNNKKKKKKASVVKTARKKPQVEDTADRYLQETLQHVSIAKYGDPGDIWLDIDKTLRIAYPKGCIAEMYNVLRADTACCLPKEPKYAVASSWSVTAPDLGKAITQGKVPSQNIAYCYDDGLVQLICAKSNDSGDATLTPVVLIRCRKEHNPTDSYTYHRQAMAK